MPVVLADCAGALLDELGAAGSLATGGAETTGGAGAELDPLAGAEFVVSAAGVHGEGEAGRRGFGAAEQATSASARTAFMLRFIETNVAVTSERGARARA